MRVLVRRIKKDSAQPQRAKEEIDILLVPESPPLGTLFSWYKTEFVELLNERLPPQDFQ